MKNSHIEWTDHTFNPWEGCTKVSPGCMNCYAENRNSRFAGGKAPNWGKGAPRRRTSDAYWKEPLKWNRQAALALWRCTECGNTQNHTDGCQSCGRDGSIFVRNRPRVFCASLADVFDDEVPEEWRIDLWTLISETKNLDWLLLTKRPQNIRDMIPWSDKPSLVGTSAGVDYWSHVWLGTSVENQEQAEKRIPVLVNAPTRTRFLSCEPLLGPVDLQKAGGIYWDVQRDAYGEKDVSCEAYINWVICGGESGPGARRMEPGWARSLRDQCCEAEIAFFFKQWGEFAPRMVAPPQMGVDGLEFVSKEIMTRVGKKDAGRLLDGRTWDEIPEAVRL